MIMMRVDEISGGGGGWGIFKCTPAQVVEL